MRFPREILPFSRQLEFPYLQNGFVLNNQGKGKVVPVPLPVIRDKIYAPNRYLRGLARYRAWGCRRVSSDFDKQDWIYVPPLNMTVAFHFFDVIANELELWKKYYAPPGPGLTILDAGAGCGETAWLFFNHFRAKKVIALEPDAERYELIQRNAKANGWNIEVHNDWFRPEYLRGVDFAKVDIEGAEFQFRDAAFPSTVMETHSDQIKDAFVARGFKVVWNNHRGCCLVRNF